MTSRPGTAPDFRSPPNEPCSEDWRRAFYTMLSTYRASWFPDDSKAVKQTVAWCAAIADAAEAEIRKREGR